METTVHVALEDPRGVCEHVQSRGAVGDPVRLDMLSDKPQMLPMIFSLPRDKVKCQHIHQHADLHMNIRNFTVSFVRLSRDTKG